MWKNIRNSKIYVIVLGASILLTVSTQITKAGYLNPGSPEDPIVTQSYVEKRNEQLKYYIDQKIGEVNNALNAVQAQQQFQIIEVQKGQKVIGKASTEMIIRSGEAKAIASPSGGLSDLIAGIDLKTGEIVPLNHLILIPRDDGRGIEVTVNKTFILIKGGYEIK
ncbi:hypothetical protein [Thermotalea metallivorans]|uniref:Uncharacterized protein n=1 Tax=Thermotalea metallivorans TaxID=520762 RepID=A0A140L1M6_9FIRM|nr:hypothetical protein [Thermotalea metallivorans]KXG74451.1 hypothetical protein AN619_23490 [Thermotalea metallivorans]